MSGFKSDSRHSEENSNGKRARDLAKTDAEERISGQRPTETVLEGAGAGSLKDKILSPITAAYNRLVGIVKAAEQSSVIKEEIQSRRDITIHLVNKRREEVEANLKHELEKYKAAQEAELTKHAMDKGFAIYKCPFPKCGTIFVNNEYLQKHLEIHVQVAPNKCPFLNCGAQFSDEDCLQKHLEMHRKENMHKCPFPQCGVLFSNEDFLQNHLEMHKQLSAKTKTD